MKELCIKCGTHTGKDNHCNWCSKCSFCCECTDKNWPPRVVYRGEKLTVESPWGGNSIFTIEPTSGRWSDD